MQISVSTFCRLPALLLLLLVSACGGPGGQGPSGGPAPQASGSSLSAAKPALIVNLKDVESPDSVAVTRDGSLLAYAGAGPIKLWHVLTRTAKATLSGHTKSVRALAFSPDGKLLASGSEDKTVKLWDVAAAKELACLKEHEDPLRSVTFLADGKTVVSADFAGRVVFWNVTGPGTPSEKMSTFGTLEVMTIAPDGKRMALGLQIERGESNLHIWDVASRTKKLSPNKYGRSDDAHGEAVFAVAFSPDGKTLAFGERDKKLFLMDPETGVVKKTLPGPDGITALAYSPNGKTLAIGRLGGTPVLFDVDSGRKLDALEGEGAWGHALTFSPDGRTLFVADSLGVLVWDVGGLTGK